MADITLYSTNCSKCNVVKTKLTELHLDFKTVTDRDTVIKVGQEHNITSAPILKVDDNYYDFSQAINFIKGQK